jgi:uncharacterized Zn-binding protein involved in type VI secretion
MPRVTRVGDKTEGICDLGLPDCPHSRSGTNSTGSPDIIVNGVALHRLTDTGPTNCPHGGTYKSVEGSNNVIANGLPVTRIGDATRCVNCGQAGHHVSGSPDVIVN